MTRYLAALGATLVVEALVVAAIAPRPRRRDFVRTSLFLNLLTHPLATLVAEQLPATPVTFLAIETAVVLAEAVLYAAIERCGPRRAVLVSLAANVPTAALSALFG